MNSNNCKYKYEGQAKIREKNSLIYIANIIYFTHSLCHIVIKIILR